MAASLLDKDERKLIRNIVAKFDSERTNAEHFRRALVVDLESPGLAPFVHSVKSRLKDSAHFRDKLERKLTKCKSQGLPFDYLPENLFQKTTDLVGARLLHLYTRQIEQIHPKLLELFEGPEYSLVEEPFARTWDNESRDFFEHCGIKCQDSESMYTSVHYVVSSNSRTQITAEVQVRTLSEEVWGEVNHRINYPHETDSIACREQIRALARATSTATRLVDAIFSSYDEHMTRKKK